MKKKFLTFLLAICFILPCAFIMTACGGDPPPDEPTLEGYTIFIKDEETSTFECVLGEQAIRAGDIRIVSKWSDESKNAIVPFNDFEVSVSWYDEINDESKTTFPDFWTNSTGYTTNDQVADYWFTLTKDGVEVSFNVNITQATKTNPQILIAVGDSSGVASAEVEWAHNDRNQDDPTECYSLKMSGLTEEDGYDENFESYYIVEKEAYDALTTIEEKKEFLDSAKNYGMPCGATGVATYSDEPGTYYIFAYVEQTNNYNYGEYGDGWIYNYATLTINDAEIIQTKQENIINYQENWDFNIDFYDCPLSSELNDDIGAYVDYEHLKQYQYIGGTWTVSDADSDTLKVPAVYDGEYYHLVDLIDWQSDMQEWTPLNHDGTPTNQNVDNSKIEMVDYTKLINYIWYDNITLPIYYKVDEIESLHYDYSKIFKTEVTINKYKLDYLPCVEPTEGNAEYGVSGTNQFEFTYDFGNDFSSKIEGAYYTAEYEYGKYFEIQGHYETDYAQNGHWGEIVLKNPNFAWEWDPSSGEYSSRPISFRYAINKEKVPYPVYSPTEGTKYTDYFDDYIEVEWYSKKYYSIDYTIEGYIEFPYIGANIYRYIMEDGDELITDRAVMAEKIRANGDKLEDNSKYINKPDNNVPGKVIIMYELINNSVTWADEKTEPVFFKFEIVKADQKPLIADENTASISANEEVYIEVSPDGTVDLKTHILDNTESVSYNYYGTDASLAFELITSIPETEYTTTGVGTLENGVITVNGNAETNPLGTFCIKITKAGNNCYNDFEMYVRVVVRTYYYDADLSSYFTSLRELDNYVTTADGYTYEGLVFEYGQKFGDFNLPELPTSEYCTFEWAIKEPTGGYSILTDESELYSSDNDVRILVTAKDGMKWFIDDSSDGNVDGIILTYWGVRFYMEQATN